MLKKWSIQRNTMDIISSSITCWDPGPAFNLSLYYLQHLVDYLENFWSIKKIESTISTIFKEDRLIRNSLCQGLLKADREIQALVNR